MNNHNNKLDTITQSLIDKLCAIEVDVYSVAKSIKICCRLLEQVDHDRISIKTRHRLCRSLAISYFILLEQEENFPEILSYIRISLTCMSLLKQSPIASHILCQALLERSLSHGHLFNYDLVRYRERQENDSCENYIKLSEENHKATLGHRFRRLPNHTSSMKNNSMNQYNSRATNNHNDNENSTNNDITMTDEDHDDDTLNIPDKKSINCYLLIEAFKSSINNIEAFAQLFVEFHCPITFDKMAWPNDETLRVTNEKNLSILRRFEQIPPFWDLYELIGQRERLGSCLTLVKSLFTANLALWSSATTSSISPDKITSTMRLIPPLAQSNLIPKAFGSAVEVFPKFGPTEVFAVLTDIWQYFKDTNGTTTPIELNNAKTKPYLNRLRLFMCQHSPGKEYVKLFKEFYEEPPTA